MFLHRIAEAMRGAWRFALALVVAALLATAPLACGDGDPDSSTPGSTAATTGESTASAGAGDDSSVEAGSSSFRTPGGDNSVQNFGEEADAAELDAAGTALANYLRARAEDDWAGQCRYLAQAARAPLEDLASSSPQLEGKGCAAVLSGLMAGTPKSTRANTMTAGIASLRFEGDRGFALYHGAKGVDYFVSMVKEDGEWKAGAIAPTEFP